jgi:hypothetical protein
MSANKTATVLLTDVDEQSLGDMPRLRLALSSGVLFLTVVKETDNGTGWTLENIVELGIDYSNFLQALRLIENEEDIVNNPYDMSELLHNASKLRPSNLPATL